MTALAAGELDRDDRVYALILEVGFARLSRPRFSVKVGTVREVARRGLHAERVLVEIDGRPMALPARQVFTDGRDAINALTPLRT